MLKTASAFLRQRSRPRTRVIVDYIDAYKTGYGVEPICRVLAQAGVQIAPSRYYAARSRQPSTRVVRGTELTEQIHRVHSENYAVYGARTVYAELNRSGHPGGPVHRGAADAGRGTTAASPGR